MIVFKLLQTQARTDATRAVPVNVRMEVVGDPHALQRGLIIAIQRVENESTDVVQGVRRRLLVLCLEQYAVLGPRWRIHAVHSATRRQYLEAGLLHQINEVQQNIGFHYFVLLNATEFAPSDRDRFLACRNRQVVVGKSGVENSGAATHIRPSLLPSMRPLDLPPMKMCVWRFMSGNEYNSGCQKSDRNASEPVSSLMGSGPCQA